MKPQPLTTCQQRDPLAIDNAHVRTLAAGNVIEDDMIDDTIQNLPTIYSPNHIQYYDLVGLGFRATARRLAQEIPTNFSVTAYLDLGTGTAITTLECVKHLNTV